MTQEMIKEAKNIVSKKIDDEKIKAIFNNVYEDTLVNSIKTLDDQSLFVLTGDIPAMWLRDSACQVRPYLPFIDQYPEVADTIAKIIDKQFFYILKDPYANAFNSEPNGEKWDIDTPLQKPIVWEQKWELDSHCFPILLSYQYWKKTDDASIFDKQYFKAVELILNTWNIEINHNEQSQYTFYREETGYLSNDGKGTPTKKTGMIWSAFRPSDDPCEYHFNVPGNLFALYALEMLAEIIEATCQKEDLLGEIKDIYASVKAGIEEHGIVTLPTGEKIYAYEVDGLGNYLLMDDSNMPSLLSLPLLTNVAQDDELYQNTRNYILSEGNPFYYVGKRAAGIGSPHTPENHIWPMALAVEGLTSEDKGKKYEQLIKIAENDADTLQVHESFHKDDDTQFTREWFSWANAMFCELVLDYCDITIF